MTGYEDVYRVERCSVCSGHNKSIPEGAPKDPLQRRFERCREIRLRNVWGCLCVSDLSSKQYEEGQKVETIEDYFDEYLKWIKEEIALLKAAKKGWKKKRNRQIEYDEKYWKAVGGSGKPHRRK